MASFVAKRALANFRIQQRARCIHNTSVVYKKKGKTSIDDLFSDESGEVGDLFKDETSSPQQPASTSTIKSTASPIATAPKKQKLSVEERRQRYDALLNFVRPRLGRKPEVTGSQVRNSAWVHLVGLATTKEQLQEISELFPAWKASGREFNSRFPELFVRRCEELSCPLLALDVFGNFAKYNVKLTLPAARQLLHSLHVEHPIDKVIAASALYSVYSLPPISQDLVSCSMLVSACYKHNSKDSLKLASALVPHLQRMASAAVPPVEAGSEKSQTWLQWTMKKVDKALLAQRGSRAEWLRDWRIRSGHILEPNQV